MNIHPDARAAGFSERHLQPAPLEDEHRIAAE